MFFVIAQAASLDCSAVKVAGVVKNGPVESFSANDQIRIREAYFPQALAKLFNSKVCNTMV